MASNISGGDHSTAQVCILFIAGEIGLKELMHSSDCSFCRSLRVSVWPRTLHRGVGQFHWIPVLSCAILPTSMFCTFVINGILTIINGKLHYQNYGEYRQFGEDMNTRGSQGAVLRLILYSTYSYPITLVEVHPCGLFFISLLHL